MRPTFFAATAAFVGTAFASGPRPIVLPAFAPTVVKLYDKDKNELGTLTIAQKGPATEFTADLTTAISRFNGTHSHNLESCEKVFSTTGDDFYVGSQTHGPPDAAESHVGDLPMVGGSGIPSDGTQSTVRSTRLTLNDLHGKTFVIHEKPDDFKSADPHGNAGAPLICGLIS